MKAIIHANIVQNENDALLIEDGIIQEISTTEKVLEKVNDQDEVIDLHGSFVLPGFIDTHIHLLNLGYTLSNVSLQYAQSLEDIVQTLKGKLPKDQNTWLIARGYNETKYPNQVGPDKSFLDNISKDIPIVLIRTCGHVLVANSKAIELAQVKESAIYENGKIDITSGIFEESDERSESAWYYKCWL